MMMKRFCLFAACACLLVDMSYAQRKVEVVETPQNSQAATSEKVIKRKVAIGRFSNETQYAKGIFYGEFYQFNLSSCIRQQNSLTAQFVSFSLSNLANIFYPPNFYNN